MKKNEWKKLALLGIAAGALVSTQAEAVTETEAKDIIDFEYVLAKPACKGKGGCGGLTASRDLNNPVIHEDEELDNNDDGQDDSDDISIPKKLA